MFANLEYSNNLFVSLLDTSNYKSLALVGVGMCSNPIRSNFY